MEPRDAVILHQPSFVVTFSFTFARCPPCASASFQNSIRRFITAFFARFGRKGRFAERNERERKRGANKERTMRTVDVRGAAKTANNGRGQ